jgi:hypothetical protein
VRGRKKSRDVIQITSRLYHIIMHIIRVEILLFSTLCSAPEYRTHGVPDKVFNVIYSKSNLFLEILYLPIKNLCEDCLGFSKKNKDIKNLS